MHAFWLTGLSASGKTTIATSWLRRMKDAGRPAMIIDGDVLRRGVCSDLGYSMADRTENNRRAAEVARIAIDAGMDVCVAMISPLASMRDAARDIVGSEHFLLFHVSTPLHVCMDRDPKGLYKRAAAGEIERLTGIDSPYEAPVTPTLRLDAAEYGPDALADQMLSVFNGGGI